MVKSRARLISSLLSLSLIVFLPTPSVADNPVPKAPFAQNLKVSPESVAPGGTVNVSFEVIASSPLRSTASIIGFRGPGGVNYERIYMQSGGTDLVATWEAAVVIPLTAPAGKYDLSYSIPFDSNGLSGGFVQKANAITVSGVGAAPKVQSVQDLSVTPSVIEPGQSVTVSFRIISSSPLQSDSSIIGFRGPGGVNYERIFQRNSGTTSDGGWSAVITIPSSAPSGDYDLSFSVPFDSNGLTLGFQTSSKALRVGSNVTPTPAVVLTPAATPAVVVTPTPTSRAASVSNLVVAQDHQGAYSRSAFKHWIDEDRNGCNTRAEVLIAEAVVKPKVGKKCVLTGGKWLSAYDGKTLTKASQLDVDHMVPLAEAWRSGAWAWTPAQRQVFANDLSDPRALIAVSLSQNRSKGDRDPASWLPKFDQCVYISHWIAIKVRYSLSVDNAEATTLDRYAASCAITKIEVEVLSGFERKAIPTPKVSPLPAATTSATPTPTATQLPTVSPGAFCSPAGATGRSASGVLYTCKTSPTDTRNRWRQ